MPEPTLQLDFGDATVATEAFRLADTDPTTARDAGVSMTGEHRIVPVDADPAWRVRFELGPLTRPAARELRRRIGARLMFHVEDPGPGIRGDPWMRAPTVAHLTDVRVLDFSPDVAHGARYEVEVTMGDVPPAAAFVPHGPDTVPPPAPLDGLWRNLREALEPPDDPPGAFGRPFLPSRPAFTGQAAVVPGAFCRPVVDLTVMGLDTGPPPGGAITMTRGTGNRFTFDWSGVTFSWGSRRNHLGQPAMGPPLLGFYRLRQIAGTGGSSFGYRQWTPPNLSITVTVTPGAGFRYAFDVLARDATGLVDSDRVTLEFDLPS